jgi:hypothetical protein
MNSQQLRKEAYDKKIKNRIFQALGAASMCWKKVPTSEFDSEKASDIGKNLMEDLTKLFVERDEIC